MRTWKKLMVGAMSIATIGAGANVAASAMSERSSRHEAQTVQVGSREAERRDDRGARESELRGRAAEQERERQHEREDHDGQNRGPGGGGHDD